MAKTILTVTQDDDGFTVSFVDQPTNEDGLSAAECALACSVIRASNGFLDASRKLLSAFKTAESSLVEFFSDGENLSDEDIDKIADVVLSDPLSGEVTRIRSGGDGHDPA